MKTTKRFENSVMKLYKAFHEGTLNAWDCSACAVGNICNNNWQWAYVRILKSDNSCVEFVIDKNNKSYEIAVDIIKKSDYSVDEIIKIESLFLSCFKQGRNDGKEKELQFLGLCAVVEYLAELDNIPNPMDYTKLFETENNKPKYQLTDAI
jgi:hypothetical protein